MKKKKQEDCRAPRHFFLKSEGMGWAPPRKETSWSGWEEAKDGKKHVGGWSQKGETEVPEIIIMSDAVEGTFVDLDGESRREQVEVKLS